MSILGEERVEALCNSRIGRGVWDHNEEFFPYHRAKHVFEESLRVEEFVKVSNDTAMPDEQKAKQMGELMNESHFSLDKLYDCSCPALDNLTKLARSSGAYGSRLTGAGWGGCIVSMISLDAQNEFHQKIKKYFSSAKSEDELNEICFTVIPGPASRLFDFTGDAIAQPICWE
eukprot:GHVN01041427.1.p3 GENE.GHVN01041427.1~~GHVN01041427.1.p3  ORF type:complete len:173 (+),score=27.49 GHVN01041427.1:2227-2745(+)